MGWVNSRQTMVCLTCSVGHLVSRESVVSKCPQCVLLSFALLCLKSWMISPPELTVDSIPITSSVHLKYTHTLAGHAHTLITNCTPRVYALFSSPRLMVMPVIMRWPVPFHPAALSVDCPTSTWDSVTSAPPIWYHQFPCDPSKVQSDPNSLTSTKPFKLFFPDPSPAFLLPQNSYNVRQLEVTSEPWQYSGSWLWAWIPMSPQW